MWMMRKDDDMCDFIFTETYIAIIGDMKGSKQIEERNVVQKQMQTVLNGINERYAPDIASKFMITLGDEFQGLLFNGTKTMHILSEIEQGMYPVKVRFGVGIGKITTDINPEMAIGADGPGYYHARAAIDFLKQNEKRKQVNVSDVRFEAESGDPELLAMLNTILSLVSVIKRQWSNRQREVIWDMLIHQDNQTNVAERLEITQPTVQMTLAKGNYYAYKEALDTIEEVLNKIRRK